MPRYPQISHILPCAVLDPFTFFHTPLRGVFPTDFRSFSRKDLRNVEVKQNLPITDLRTKMRTKVSERMYKTPTKTMRTMSANNVRNGPVLSAARQWVRRSAAQCDGAGYTAGAALCYSAPMCDTPRPLWHCKSRYMAAVCSFTRIDIVDACMTN